jgi:hypothetical protein
VIQTEIREVTMLDRDTKELLIGFTAIVLFALAIVYFRQ